MVLGQVDFSAANGTIYSAEAMSNPYSRRMTLDTGFLTADSLQATVTDAHLDARDRMGRLMAFMARSIKDGLVTSAADMRGIGVDVETALEVEDGVATVVGLGKAYFLKPMMGGTLICEPKTPLTFTNVDVFRRAPGENFNLGNYWGSENRPSYQIYVSNGSLFSNQVGGSPY
jgi:cyanophycinase-like exopeptidase